MPSRYPYVPLDLPNHTRIEAGATITAGRVEVLVRKLGHLGVFMITGAVGLTYLSSTGALLRWAYAASPKETAVLNIILYCTRKLNARRFLDAVAKGRHT